WCSSGRTERGSSSGPRSWRRASRASRRRRGTSARERRHLARRAADEVRVGSQSEGIKGAWPDDSAFPSSPRRSGNRIMDRRTLLYGLGVGLLAPLAVEAQQAGKVWRIGSLASYSPTSPEVAPLWEGFLQGLRELGYVEGKNFVIEGRYSEGRH